MAFFDRNFWSGCRVVGCACGFYVSADSSDWIKWKIGLTDEEARVYDEAIANDISLNEHPSLQDALMRAYKEIEAEEISNGLDYGDEYVKECLGETEVDPFDINALVASRDPYTIAFFGLTDANDEELDEWDANDLDENPDCNSPSLDIADVIHKMHRCCPSQTLINRQ